MDRTTTQTLSVVIPVYRQSESIEALLSRLEQVSRDSAHFEIREIILVNDSGRSLRPDLARKVRETPILYLVNLMRNYGQHPATAAGILHSTSDWVITMDEDLQHSPEEISKLFEAARLGNFDLVYGSVQESGHFSRRRRLGSAFAHLFARYLAGFRTPNFSSFRLVRGEKARSACAHVGPKTFLDFALEWATSNPTVVEVRSGADVLIESSYDFSRLMSHFSALVLANPIRICRLLSASGLCVAVSAIAAGLMSVINFIRTESLPQGWTSTFIVITFLGGVSLIILGLIAELLALLLQTVRGRPAFLIGSPPEQ